MRHAEPKEESLDSIETLLLLPLALVGLAGFASSLIHATDDLETRSGDGEQQGDEEAGGPLEAALSGGLALLEMPDSAVAISTTGKEVEALLDGGEALVHITPAVLSPARVAES